MLGKPGQVEIMHIIEKRLRIHAMHLHQATQRGAELPIIGLLQVPRVFDRNAKKARNEFAHAPVDLSEQVAFDRIERVVEIEDPHLCALKVAWCWGAAEHVTSPFSPCG